MKSNCFLHFTVHFNICTHILSKFTLIVHEITQKICKLPRKYNKENCNVSEKITTSGKNFRDRRSQQSLQISCMVAPSPGQGSINPATPNWRTWSKFGEHGEQGEYGEHQKHDLDTLFMTQNTPAVIQMT